MKLASHEILGASGRSWRSRLRFPGTVGRLPRGRQVRNRLHQSPVSMDQSIRENYSNCDTASITKHCNRIGLMT